MAGYDPRRHSTVTLQIKERTPLYYGSTGRTGSSEAPMKSFMVGPNKADGPGINSLHRPNTAPVASVMDKFKKNGDAHPDFINPNGKWVQEKVPDLIADSQAQPLCATGTLSSTMTGRYGANRDVRPLTTIYSYNDISPVATAAYVRDGEETDPVSTVRFPAKTVEDSLPMGSLKGGNADWTAKTTMGNPSARVDSISSFWNRLGGVYPLQIKDTVRIQELGQNVVPGTPNCRLIGSKWRYIPRPVEGDVIYTDFYGKCGDDACNYYGRRYDIQTTEFNQNGLVGDGDYIKVKASMAGIQSLRTRPGLSLNATVVSGQSSTVAKLTPYSSETTRGVHRLHAHARLKAASARPEWQS